MGGGRSVPTSTVIGAKQHRVTDNFRNPAKTGSWGKGNVHCNRSTHAECGRHGNEPAGWAVQGRLPVVDTGRMNPSGGLIPVRPRRWAVRSGRGSRCRLAVGGTSGEARLCSTDQGHPIACTSRLNEMKRRLLDLNGRDSLSVQTHRYDRDLVPPAVKTEAPTRWMECKPVRT